MDHYKAFRTLSKHKGIGILIRSYVHIVADAALAANERDINVTANVSFDLRENAFSLN